MATRTKRKQPAKQAGQLTDREVLIGQISVFVTDDQLMAIIAEADDSGNATAHLKRALAEHNATADDSPVDSVNDYRVVQKTVPIRDNKTLAIRQQPVGFILERDAVEFGESVKLYAGKTGVWTHYGQAAPCETELEAKALGRIMEAAAQAATVAFDFQVRQLTLAKTVPCRIGEGSPRSPLQLTLHLNAGQTDLVYAVLDGLRKTNVEHAGKPIANAQDAIRYVLSLLA